jgi:hypothetical protein
VADHHTYFVGSLDGNFSLWAHNADCFPQTVVAAVHEVLQNHKTIPTFPRGLAERVAAQMRIGTDEALAEAVRLLQGAEGGLPGVGPVRAQEIVENIWARMGALPGNIAIRAPHTTAVLRDGYYESNGFRFSDFYYNRLRASGNRPAPGFRAEALLQEAPNPIPEADIPARFLRRIDGFQWYEGGGWEMYYNPTTRVVWHLQPIN